MLDNFELTCYNYSPTDRINWVAVDNTDKKKTLFVALLYNSNKKSENYFLTLFMLADEQKEKFTLLVRGNLNNWYSQKILGRTLTIEEYKDCINLLLAQLDVERNDLINAKMKNAEIRLSVLLNPTSRSKKHKSKFTPNL
jgi:hypothetical protein